MVNSETSSRQECSKYDTLEKVVNSAFENILQTLPETYKKILTVLDFNFIPEGVVDKRFIEREFFPLSTEKDFEYIDDILQGAKETLSNGRYYFEERPNKFPVKIDKRFEKGFKSIDDVLGLFSIVLPNKNDKLLNIIDSELKGKKSNRGEREAACRILKKALVNYSLKPHIDILPQAVGSLFGENGPFRGIETDILKKEKQRREEAKTIYGMRSVKSKSKKEKVIFGNQNYESGPFYNDNIKEIYCSFKDTGKASSKIERKKNVKGSDINDLYRMKITFDSKKLKKTDKVKEIIGFMSDMEKMFQNSAKFMAKDFGIKDLKVEVESREINYLSEEEKDYYFPNKIEENSNFYSGDLDNIYLKPANKTKKSADNFHNMSQKIRYIDPKTNKYIFSFEVQYLTDKEDDKNENERQSGSHFMKELRDHSIIIFSKGGGKRNKEGIIKSIKRHLMWYQSEFIDTKRIDNFPTSLYGEMNETLGWESPKKYGKFRSGGYENGVKDIYFTGFRKANMEEKAEKVFAFLWAEGRIRKVPHDFPENVFEGREATDKMLKSSPYFYSAGLLKDVLSMKKEV